MYFLNIEGKNMSEIEMNTMEIKWNNYWGDKKIIEQQIKKNNAYNDVMNILLKLTTEKSNCIEIGCGSGTYAIELIVNGRKCLATDLTDEALELTKAKAKYLYNIDVPTMKADLFNLPFKGDTFDLIFSDGVIEHIDIQKALNAMYQKLKPGGWLVAKVPTGNLPYRIAYYTLSVLENKHMFEAWHSANEWVTFAKKANLKNISITRCGGFFVGIGKRFLGNTKLIRYVPNILRIHYIFYGQK